MTAPRLRTSRLLLREWQPGDVAALADIYADPEVERQLVPMSLADTEAQVTRFAEAWDHDGASLWAVEELATGRFVGRVGVLRARAWPLEDSPLEVGWTFARHVWGRGYATEGGAASLSWAWVNTDVARVISFTRPTNLASRRVMEKLGLDYRGAVDYKGIPHVWYAVDRPVSA